MDGQVGYVDVPSERYFLTIAGRCLNFSTLEEGIRDLYSLLKHALQFDHYSPQTKAEVRLNWKEICTEEELNLMELVTAPAEAA